MAQLKILSHLLLGERVFSQCSTSVRVQRASLHPEFAIGFGSRRAPLHPQLAMVFGPRRAPLHLELAIWLGSRRAPLHPGLRYSGPLVPRVRTNWHRSRQGGGGGRGGEGAGGGGRQKEGKGEKSHLSQNLDVLTWQVGKKKHTSTNKLILAIFANLALLAARIVFFGWEIVCFVFLV